METILDAAQNEQWLCVTAVYLERRDLTLRFQSVPSDRSELMRTWLVSCCQVRDMCLTDFDGGGLRLSAGDHPVARQFSSPKASIVIELGARSRAECEGVLLEAHRSAVDDWIEFDRFTRLGGPLQSSAPRIVILAPEFLLVEYHRHAIRADFVARLKNYKRKLYWSGFGWSERCHRVSVLHFGNSFVAAESFSAITDTPGPVPADNRSQPTARSQMMKRRG